MSMLFLMLFAGSSIFRGLLDAPPRDFASLLHPKKVLEQLQVQTDEASLIALLAPEDKVKIGKDHMARATADLGSRDPTVRRRAREILEAAGENAIPHLEKARESEDVEVRETAKELLAKVEKQRQAAIQNNTDYLKKLMAIRALEQMKSKAALPALKQLADGGDPTLSDAAANAVRIINGQAVQRPKGADTIKAVMARLPANAGFVATVDLERASRTQTIDVLLEALEKEAGKDPQMQAMVGQFGNVTMEIEKGLVKGLGQIGNVRIDSITMLASTDLGTARHAGYVAWIFKGLHDPAMVANAIKAENSRIKERQYKKQTVLFQSDIAFCSPDKNTLIIAVSEANDGSQIHPILDAWGGPEKKVDPTLKPAFDSVIAGRSRLAAAGSLSAAQKQLIKNELGANLAGIKQRMQNNPRPEHAMEVAGFEMILEQLKVDRYFGYLDKDAQVIIESICPDADSARTVAAKVNALDRTLRDMIAQQMAKMKQRGGNNPFANIMAKIDLKKPFFEAKAVDKKVTTQVKAMDLSPLGLLPLLMMRGF